MLELKRSNNLHVFNNEEFGEIKILIKDGKEFFPATECARMLSYKNPHKAIIDHCKNSIVLCTNDSLGRKQEINFINEGDLYRLIVKSKLPSAIKFEKWVFDKVLPEMRKKGTYTMYEVAEDFMANPDNAIRFFTELKTEKEKRKKLEIENQELKPKATYHDLILQSEGLMPITKIAKDYGMSGKAFNKLLNELKVQYFMGDAWILYQKYADKGYTQSKTHIINADKSKVSTYWTQKGRKFIYQLLKNEKNILPVIELEEVKT